MVESKPARFPLKTWRLRSSKLTALGLQFNSRVHSKHEKLIWAVDAYTEDKLLHKKSCAFLRTWCQTHPAAVVEPVFVMSPDQMRVPTEIFANLKEVAEKPARDLLKQLLKGCEVPNLQKPIFLASENYSLSLAVKTFLDYARKSNADYLLVSTQSRKGITRFLFGSFAESLILQSDIPVYIISPISTIPKRSKKLFFATDLGVDTMANYEEILSMAEKNNLDLTLFNKLEYLTQYTADILEKNQTFHLFLERDISQRKKRLETMVAMAKDKGISAKFILDSQIGDLNIHDSILKNAKKAKADYLALASHSSPIAKTILGSVTRQVVHHSTLPICLFHPIKKTTFPQQTKSKRGAV